MAPSPPNITGVTPKPRFGIPPVPLKAIPDALLKKTDQARKSEAYVPLKAIPDASLKKMDPDRKSEALNAFLVHVNYQLRQENKQLRRALREKKAQRCIVCDRVLTVRQVVDRKKPTVGCLFYMCEHCGKWSGWVEEKAKLCPKCNDGFTISPKYNGKEISRANYKKPVSI